MIIADVVLRKNKDINFQLLPSQSQLAYGKGAWTTENIEFEVIASSKNGIIRHDENQPRSFSAQQSEAIRWIQFDLSCVVEYCCAVMSYSLL